MKETYVTYKLWQGCSAPRNLESGSRLIGERVAADIVDRDELLNVADEIERIADNASTDTIGPFLQISTIRPANVKAFADRIRKALGIER